MIVSFHNPIIDCISYHVWYVKVVQPHYEELQPCADNGEALQDIDDNYDAVHTCEGVPQPCADNGESMWPLCVNGKVP